MKEERHNMWASILISRDLPYGLMVNKGNNYHCGGELYYPAAASYQLVDIIEKENLPANIIERVGSTNPADANSGRGEKRPNVPIQGDTPTENIVPSQTFFQPIKILGNLSPQGPLRPKMLETQPSVLETGIGAQVMTLVGEDESAEVNTIGHSEEVSTESYEMIPMPEDHALELVAALTEEDFLHRVIFGSELSLFDTTAIEVEFQPLFALSSYPPSTRPLEAPRSGPNFQSTAIMVDHAIVTSGVPSATPIDGSATLEPVIMLTSGALALVVDAILPEHPLEVSSNVFTLI
ncbi:PREDICTED: PRUPE_3G140800 [Prunus dulcis]|uniref:PREDICTED: PRUPE_3G140800 n=1 Tax=Prunus dulcis TaxID=3755 RepID=A0A5E4FH57_PRUDU|nr:PREDICTED: PRUPE_3G140800 [Prunus dulcis]